MEPAYVPSLTPCREPVDDDFYGGAARWYPEASIGSTPRHEWASGRRYVAAASVRITATGRYDVTQALLSRRRRGRLSPKEVETALRAYEVMVILDPDLEERTVAPSLEQYLNNVVVKDGGSVEKLDVWGRRRLAYEVNKNAEGIYAVIDLQAEPATVKELDRQLSLNESVLRTKVIRPDVR
jgi:small subunit ribosomal protein S6